MAKKTKKKSSKRVKRNAFGTVPTIPLTRDMILDVQECAKRSGDTVLLQIAGEALKGRVWARREVAAFLDTTWMHDNIYVRVDPKVVRRRKKH